jgi:hypothetical protein
VKIERNGESSIFLAEGALYMKILQGSRDWLYIGIRTNPAGESGFLLAVVRHLKARKIPSSAIRSDAMLPAL